LIAAEIWYSASSVRFRGNRPEGLLNGQHENLPSVPRLQVIPTQNICPCPVL